MNLSKYARIVSCLAAGGLLLVGLFLLLNGTSQVARADPGDLFVSSSGSGSACTQAAPCALQTALSQATDGDTIYVVGGTYTGVGSAVITITKSITLYGGWDGAASGPVVRDPAAHVTILDGQGARRVVYIQGNITPTLDGLTITGGNASSAPAAGYGGGIYSRDASPVIQNNIIISNVGGITPTYGTGGGLYLGYAPASAIISGNQILSNTSMIGGPGNGGGLYISYSDATIRGNLVQSNTSSHYGGGMYISYGAPRLIGNEIRGNVAVRNAGGIYISWGAPLVQGNLVVGNLGGGDGHHWNGGGMEVSPAGSPTITGNQFIGNSAGTGGGFGLSTGDWFTVTNNVIVHNSSGIRLWEVTRYGLIAHNTIAFNGGEGGIRLNYPYITPTIVNNIVVSNTYGISAHADASGTLDYNDVWGNTTQDYNLPGALQPGPHSLQADPLFVDPAGDDYHLRAGSPCIDVGLDVGVTTDLEGHPRPHDGGYDLGAYEYGLWHWLYLPVVMKNHP